MASKILKYPLDVVDSQVIQMPIGATILCVQYQHEILTLWAQVDDNPNTNPRKIRIIGTGRDFVSLNLEYISTIQQYGGKLVWHVYEERLL